MLHWLNVRRAQRARYLFLESVRRFWCLLYSPMRVWTSLYRVWRPLSSERSVARYSARRTCGCTFTTRFASRTKSGPCRSRPYQFSSIRSWLQRWKDLGSAREVNAFVHLGHGMATPYHNGIWTTIFDTEVYYSIFRGSENDWWDAFGHGGLVNTLF